MSLDSQDAFNEYLQHSLEHRILICKSCAIAVPPTQIVSHLQSKHPSVTPSTRVTIQKIVEQLPNLAIQPNELRLPPSANVPFFAGKIYKDGYICKVEECWYVARSRTGIRAHCQKAHNRESNRAGRPCAGRQQTTSWISGQACQELYRASGWPSWLAVKAETETIVGDTVQQAGFAELQRRRAEQIEAAKSSKIQDGVRLQADPWLRFTGWLVRLHAQDRTLLRETMHAIHNEEARQDKPRSDNDSDVNVICDTMRKIIYTAFKTCTHESVGRATLEVINRRETGAPSNELPLYTGHKVTTIRKYSTYILAIIRFIWRTYQQKEPLYCLTDAQKHCLNTIQSELLHCNYACADQRKTLKIACVVLWVSLLDHDLTVSENDSALLSGLAVLGIKEKQGWMPAHQYQQVLSAVITTSKVLVVYSAYISWQEDVYQGIFDSVQASTQRFLTLTDYGGRPTPMNRMLRMRTYAKAIAKEQKGEPILNWSPDGTLLVGKSALRIPNLQAGVRALCAALQEQLFREILLLEEDSKSSQQALPKIDIGKLVDAPSNVDPGYSFLEHPSNNLEKWKDWLYERVLSEVILQQKFVQRIDHSQQLAQIKWNDAVVSTYMKQVRRFKEGLLVAVHLTGGGPARSTELLSLQYKNGEAGFGYRGVFVDRGLVYLSTRYHKGFSRTSKVKLVHRYVPNEVGELVVYFLALAQPFVDTLMMLHKGVMKQNAWIWQPAQEETWRAEEAESDDSDSDTDDTQSLDLECQPANPDGLWTSERIRRIMHEYTLRYVDAALNIRDWRHCYVAINRKHSVDPRLDDIINAMYYDKPRDIEQTVLARAKQSAHTMDTEERIYGLNVHESPWAAEREREEFRAASINWHRFLQFPSAWSKHSHRPEIQDAILSEQYRRWTALQQADLTACLRTLSSQPNAAFRGKQEEAIQAVTERKLRVICVMPTGSGKSMLFMIPALVSQNSGVTIVIVPLLSLKDNMQARCDELGLSCAHWHIGLTAYTSRIVLVTPETAVSRKFSQFLAETHARAQLDRIVIDECHVILESSATWRPQVLQLVEMTEKETQVVYLTATLPPRLQPALLKAVGIQPSDATVIRDCTTRSNIAYKVQSYPRTALDLSLLDLVQRKRTEYSPSAQIIVFCPTTAETKRLAKILNCTAYWSGVGLSDMKERMVREFASGSVKLCTATSMLGLGLDAKSVRIVIHVSCPRSLCEYVQESGRGGRGGERSEAIVMRAEWIRPNNAIKQELRDTWEPAVKEYISSAVCRRIAIDKEMDGRLDRLQCAQEEAKCDICEEKNTNTKRLRQDTPDIDLEPAQCRLGVAPATLQNDATQSSRLIVTAQTHQKQISVQKRRLKDTNLHGMESLESVLQQWCGACIICSLTNGQRAIHKWQECRHVDQEKIKDMTAELKWLETLAFEDYSGCYRCLAPQAICNSWDESLTLQGAYHEAYAGKCQYSGVLREAVAVLLTFRKPPCRSWLDKKAAEEGLTQGRQKERWGLFFTKKTSLGFRNTNMVCSFLLAWSQGEIFKCM